MEPIITTTISSPRISFSADFLDENDFISISPNSEIQKDVKKEKERARNAAEFEFLSSKPNSENMITADELFFEGKLLPFWQMHHCEKLGMMSLKTEKNKQRHDTTVEMEKNNDERPPWFLDDDPSPRPPKCTVLWKELLRLRKQRSASSLSPSSSTSSSSSGSLSDAVVPPANERKDRERQAKTRIKKGLERTRSATIRVRPVINVPICTQGKSSALPPLFSFKKGKLLER